MKLLKTFTLVALILLSGAAFSQQNFNLFIKADFQNVQDTFDLSLMQLKQQGTEEISTATVIPGKTFTLNTRIEEGGFYQLVKDANNYMILVTEPGENINITVDMEDFTRPIITGSEGSELFYNFLPKFISVKEQMDSLERVYAQMQQSGAAVAPETQKKLVESYQSLQNHQKKIIKNLIVKNPGNLTGLMFVDQLSEKQDFQALKTYAYTLKDKYPQNVFVKEFYNKIAAEAKTAVGETAPEIDLPSPEGENIKLSSLQGEVVLIDFWASWCGPCRKENPNMVRIYNRFRDQGFEIYGVSLDRNRENWLKAIEKDSLTWVHVSDLKYWKSKAAKAYNVGSIPYTVLLDKDGKIIAKGLRGEELEAKLEEIFN